MNSVYKEPINIGSDQEISINDLSFLISEKLGKVAKIESYKKLVGEPKYRKPSIKKALKELHWEPSISLQNGLDILISEITNK